MKTAAKVLIALLVVSGVGLAALLWKIDGAFQTIQWVTADETLRLRYLPGKQQAHVDVIGPYVAGSPRNWVVEHPGASQRWWGAPPVPPPEVLFVRAQFPCAPSDPVGLVGVYEDVSEFQRRQVLGVLEYECERSPEVRSRLEVLARDRQLAWLSELLAQAERRPGSPESEKE